MTDALAGTWHWFGLSTTVGVMLAAVWSDVRGGVIPNRLTYPAALLGLGLNFLSHGVPGLLSALGGFALAFGVLFLAYLFGGFAGGDLKLASALGALVGLESTALGLLYMGLLAGLISFAIMIWKGKLLSSLARMGRYLFTTLTPFLKSEPLKPENSDAFPLGVAIVGGFAWAVVEQFLGARPLLRGLAG